MGTGINKCDCFHPWTGGDCSLRSCPTAMAWADVASGTDVAHGKAICSNRGLCNYSTGQCQCEEGYEGISCSRLACPNACSGHGRCRSMRYQAQAMDLGRPTFSYEDNWDADHIFGCECDPDYTGFDCSERVCPRGDDPLTGGQHDEVQLVRCDLDPAGSDKVLLYFRKQYSLAIAPDATAEELKAALQAMETIGSVDVKYNSADGSISTFCDDQGAYGWSRNVVEIAFLSEHGDLPDLVPKTVDGVDFSGALAGKVVVGSNGDALDRGDGSKILSVKGTKESAYCSGRGTCDTARGICKCYTGFVSSDGRGNVGDHGDCGVDVDPITSCPGIQIECSGHGVCSDNAQFKCTCQEGWTAGDCSQRTCPTGKAWFDEPNTENERAHGQAECSNRGLCDRASGKCQCQTGFEGEACERASCPGSTTSQGACSGHGRCLSMRDLASEATDNGDAAPQSYGAIPHKAATWDHDQMFGCSCDDGFTGADCSLRTCPLGDDVTTHHQYDEVQSFVCRAITSASFKLKFRQAVTAELLHTASAADVEAALEALETIGDVAVHYDGSNTEACSANPGTTITISFKTENGDVPPITVVDTGFNNGFDIAFTSLTATEVSKGTTENEECSGRGICNRETGNCECFVGFGSSNGSGGAGDVPDCGFREPYLPVSESKWPKVAAHGKY